MTSLVQNAACLATVMLLCQHISVCSKLKVALCTSGSGKVDICATSPINRNSIKICFILGNEQIPCIITTQQMQIFLASMHPEKLDHKSAPWKSEDFNMALILNRKTLIHMPHNRD